MAYTKQPVQAGDIMDPAWGNHVQTQYDEAVTHEGWTDVTFENGWSRYDSTDPAFPRVQYRKLSNNLVQIRGIMKRSTAIDGTAAFSLPTGYKPPANVYVPCVCSGWTFGSASISSGGGFVPRSGDNNWVAFNVIYEID